MRLSDGENAGFRKAYALLNGKNCGQEAGLRLPQWHTDYYDILAAACQALGRSFRKILMEGAIQNAPVRDSAFHLSAFDSVRPFPRFCHEGRKRRIIGADFFDADSIGRGTFDFLPHARAAA